jgi:hypothetical protein
MNKVSTDALLVTMVSTDLSTLSFLCKDQAEVERKTEGMVSKFTITPITIFNDGFIQFPWQFTSPQSPKE